METKKYSSYAQIDRELEILKIEKEISYQKLVFGVKKTKESFSPQHIVSDLIGSYSSAIPYGAIVSTAVPFILNKAVPFIKNWITKRKRGN
ncbi:MULTISPECIES: DUF6327 family protein [Flavobacterium]|uniref:Uncharacterized protein n=1 Tax=Flavobacterium ranwuense TaxID=2541725 RepID=A0ABY2DVX7_9FLAO|nr:MULTISPECIES: DUF6327 family protein [Flavobacterium]TDE31499.1 hypothetical protein E0I61_02035 [Flavobacterium ranwuense]TDE55195.1 hypothetical protein E0H99_02440 [Flavobacterium sp. GT3P67]